MNIYAKILISNESPMLCDMNEMKFLNLKKKVIGQVCGYFLSEELSHPARHQELYHIHCQWQLLWLLQGYLLGQPPGPVLWNGLPDL